MRRVLPLPFCAGGCIVHIIRLFTPEFDNLIIIYQKFLRQGPRGKTAAVIELFIEKEECMQAKLSCSAIANKPQQVVEFIGDILEAQIVVPMFLGHLN